jgi:H+/Cl- antiporter ClcA
LQLHPTTAYTRRPPIGLITAAASFAVNYGVENISGFKFKATLTLLNSGHAVASFAVYCAINAALVLAAVALTTQVAPAAAGSGIAEVKVGFGCRFGLPSRWSGSWLLLWYLRGRAHPPPPPK